MLTFFPRSSKPCGTALLMLSEMSLNFTTCHSAHQCRMAHSRACMQSSEPKGEGRAGWTGNEGVLRSDYVRSKQLECPHGAQEIRGRGSPRS